MAVKTIKGTTTLKSFHEETKEIRNNTQNVPRSVRKFREEHPSFFPMPIRNPYN